MIFFSGWHREMQRDPVSNAAFFTDNLALTVTKHADQRRRSVRIDREENGTYSCLAVTSAANSCNAEIKCKHRAALKSPRHAEG